MKTPKTIRQKLKALSILGTTIHKKKYTNKNHFGKDLPSVSKTWGIRPVLRALPIIAATADASKFPMVLKRRVPAFEELTKPAKKAKTVAESFGMM